MGTAVQFTLRVVTPFSSLAYGTRENILDPLNEKQIFIPTWTGTLHVKLRFVPPS